MISNFHSTLDLPVDEPETALAILAHIIGGIATLSATGDVPEGSGVILADTSTGAITLTLRHSDLCLSSKRVTFKPTSAANNLTVAPAVGDTVDGGGSVVVSFPNSLTVVTDNNGWWII